MTPHRCWKNMPWMARSLWGSVPEAEGYWTAMNGDPREHTHIALLTYEFMVLADPYADPDCVEIADIPTVLEVASAFDQPYRLLPPDMADKPAHIPWPLVEDDGLSQEIYWCGPWISFFPHANMRYGQDCSIRGRIVWDFAGYEFAWAAEPCDFDEHWGVLRPIDVVVMDDTEVMTDLFWEEIKTFWSTIKVDLDQTVTTVEELSAAVIAARDKMISMQVLRSRLEEQRVNWMQMLKEVGDPCSFSQLQSLEPRLLAS